jgi:CheY-like chemotaxis protein
MGLGLTIAKLLTEIMGGELLVTSKLGVGSRFRIRLMLSQSVRALAPVLSERRITGYLGSRRTILVADDDPVHRSLLYDLLVPLGFTVLAATHGAECLETAAQTVCDLFLIDLSMPGMTGWDLAGRLREHYPIAPIIIISADGRAMKQPPTTEITYHDDTLTKPISLVALLDRVGRLLQLDWITSEAAPEPVGDHRLSADQLDTLREMAAIGHVSGLRTQLDILDREAPGGSAQIAQLRSLLADYELEAFLGALNAEAPAQPVAGAVR